MRHLAVTRRRARRPRPRSGALAVPVSERLGPAPQTPPLFPGEPRADLLPIKHRELWDLYKQIESSHWTVEPVRAMLKEDGECWRQMSAEHRAFVGPWLGFFARADNIALDLQDLLAKRLPLLELQFLYKAIEAQECVHIEAYQLQLNAIARDATELQTLLTSLTGRASVKAAIAWAQQWHAPTVELGDLLVAIAAIEGLMFSGAFCVLQWMRERSLLRGITQFNEYIMRDEGMHCTLSCILLRQHVRWPVERAHAIMRDAERVATDLVTDSLAEAKFVDMDADKMQEYVRFQADFVLRLAGFAPAFNARNPFPFMEKVAQNATAKANFFESRTTAYRGPSARAVDLRLL